MIPIGGLDDGFGMTKVRETEGNAISCQPVLYILTGFCETRYQFFQPSHSVSYSPFPRSLLSGPHQPSSVYLPQLPLDILGYLLRLLDSELDSFAESYHGSMKEA